MSDPLFLYFSDETIEETRCAVFEAVRCILLEEFVETDPEIKRRLRGAKQALLRLNLRFPPDGARREECQAEQWTTLSRSRMLLTRAIERVEDEEERSVYRRVTRALSRLLERR